MKFFWVDKDDLDFDMGYFGVDEEYAKEISALLFILTNGEDKSEEIKVKPLNKQVV